MAVRWVWLFVGCVGGAPTPEGACLTSADCPAGEECSDGDEVVCGIGPIEGCTTDDTCGAGAMCSAVGDSCSADGVGTDCTAPCATDAECGGPDFRCATSGACEAVPCDEGFACAPGEACSAAALGDHGCAAISCSADADCPADGPFCVQGACGPNAGSCVEPQLVP